MTENLRDRSNVQLKTLKELEEEIKKMKKRESKLVKQLIKANLEIENFGRTMELKMKEKENNFKNELMKELQDKEQTMNEGLYGSQRRVEDLKGQLQSIQIKEQKGADEVIQMKEFFKNKMANAKTTLTKKFKKREKEIVKKAIVAYNKKKEKIYRRVIKKALNIINRPPELETFLRSLREALDMAEDVYRLENFSLCGYCGEVIHISEIKCINCKMKVK